MRKNRTYTKEFKRQALNLVQRGDKSLKSIAESLGIPSSTLLQWKINTNKQGNDIYTGEETISPEQAEISKLRKSLLEAEMERDILKDAISIFGKKKV
jgi:transposase-like protein